MYCRCGHVDLPFYTDCLRQLQTHPGQHAFVQVVSRHRVGVHYEDCLMPLWMNQKFAQRPVTMKFYRETSHLIKEAVIVGHFSELSVTGGATMVKHPAYVRSSLIPSLTVRVLP